MVSDLVRYYVAKASGSEWVYVQDRATPVPVKRYNIFRRYGGYDGWTCAHMHADSLNAEEARQALTGEAGR